MNQATNNGCTPLYVASEKGHSEAVGNVFAGAKMPFWREPHGIALSVGLAGRRWRWPLTDPTGYCCHRLLTKLSQHGSRRHEL